MRSTWSLVLLIRPAFVCKKRYWSGLGWRMFRKNHVTTNNVWMDKIALLTPKNTKVSAFLIEVRRQKKTIAIVHCAPCRESFFLHSLHCSVLLNHHTASQSVRSHLVVQSFKSKVPPWPISEAIYTTFSISSRIIQLSQPFLELLIIQGSTFWTLWIESCKITAQTPSRVKGIPHICCE